MANAPEAAPAFALRPFRKEPVLDRFFYVSDRELSRLVRHWKGGHVVDEPTRPASAMTQATLAASSQETQAVEQPPWARFKTKAEATEEEDDLSPQAIEALRSHNRASISLLQRRLHIGYAQPAPLIDLMAEQRIIGPDEGSARSRRVLLDSPADDSPLKDRGLTERMDCAKQSTLDLARNFADWTSPHDC